MQVRIRINSSRQMLLRGLHADFARIERDWTRAGIVAVVSYYRTLIISLADKWHLPIELVVQESFRHEELIACFVSERTFAHLSLDRVSDRTRTFASVHAFWCEEPTKRTYHGAFDFEEEAIAFVLNF